MPSAFHFLNNSGITALLTLLSKGMLGSTAAHLPPLKLLFSEEQQQLSWSEALSRTIA